ncbi:energy transducer TonB [Teichococcus aestuarii]|uniref:TonB C-terminal domain-containing protein n=2 Tax=Teichococcus aestuarii TaxID=568898 RepID=A0A2U1UYH4_9PROT|nr:energy transducer TonB [Pseudoroseomonas aestuarii]PWC26705.1 hypothetical protein CR165_21720 [Pseudoroseomonas aestuarii]
MSTSLTGVTAPPSGGRPGRPRLRLGPGLAASLLLHAALATWLLWSHTPEPLPRPAEGEGVPVVFESAAGEAGPALPQPQAPVGAPEVPGGAPAPLEPPDVSAPPGPSQPPPPPPPQAAPVPPAPPLTAPPLAVPPQPETPLATPPLAAPPTAAPPPPPVAEAPPPPAPPAEAPPAPPAAPPLVAEAPPVPEGELPAPPPPAPLPDLSAELAPPTPFRLSPPRLPLAPPQPEAPPRPNPLAGTLSLGPQAARPIAPAPQARPAPGRPGQLDMAIGPVPQRSLAPGQPAYSGSAAMAHVSGARPGRNWGRAFQAWVQSRGFYPPQAAAAGEDGPVVLRVTVARDGRIEAVQITGRSGSRWLDAAALSLFRDQVGPAFTAEMEGDSTTLTFTVNYRIVYR